MTGKTCFGSATLKSAQNFRPEKIFLSKVSGELWEVCGLMVIALVSECQAVWVQALAGDIVLCSGTKHFTLSVPLSQPRCINKWVLANLNAGDNPVMD